MSRNDPRNSADVNGSDAARQDTLRVDDGGFRTLDGSPSVPPPLAETAQHRPSLMRGKLDNGKPSVELAPRTRGAVSGRTSHEYVDSDVEESVNKTLSAHLHTTNWLACRWRIFRNQRDANAATPPTLRPRRRSPRKSQGSAGTNEKNLMSSVFATST
jgi:hypothetical protein